MIVLSDMQCHDFMQIQTMRPWLRVDQAFVSIAAEPPFPTLRNNRPLYRQDARDTFESLPHRFVHGSQI